MTESDTTKNGTPAKTRLFSQPLRQNPKAIRPLYAVILASGCWEAAALLLGTSSGRTQDHFGEAFVLAGLALQLLTVIGSIVYRHFQVALLSLAAAVLVTYSGYKHFFLWIFFPWYPFLWVEQAFGPVFAEEYLQSHSAGPLAVPLAAPGQNRVSGSGGRGNCLLFRRHHPAGKSRGRSGASCLWRLPVLSLQQER